ncbi:class I SAM-dependent methyltransferase [Aestuariimicrobium sp. T2.26MG-19.2B]|uniref:class I SAM-dependent methyltransferase n=1 Tax=Aestuariimicrobium sp. T2.26MG-19.2B TaxID=3040679 RepID=UPI0025421ADF|nr:class I SAM-dependent methyltransferase [Aestuariimicrobium sp. T2.26MG-19.2B]
MSTSQPAPHPLTVGEGPMALERALAQPDPDSLTAASALRRLVAPELAALALEQASLRRRARSKFGDRAADMLFTATGLEQATRPEVSAWRADTFAEGCSRVLDLGCGLGFDALAMGRAGLGVDAVELDPLTASCAQHNLASVKGRVLVGDAASAVPAVMDGGVLVFVDPARRSSTGRSWRLEDLSPGWDFVLSLRQRCDRLVVKLGPGISRSLLPDDLGRHWVSHEGTLVEVCLATDVGEGPAVDRVVVLRGGRRYELVGRGLGRLPVEDVGEYLHEPDPAVIRSQLYAEACSGTNAWLVDHDVAYLSSDGPLDTPLVTSFRVLESIPWSVRTLRAWCREHRIGTLEIKKRGLDVDPAELRRQLKLKGSASATVVLTPTPRGTRALVCERVPRSP